MEQPNNISIKVHTSLKTNISALKFSLLKEDGYYKTSLILSLIQTYYNTYKKFTNEWRISIFLLAMLKFLLKSYTLHACHEATHWIVQVCNQTIQGG